MRTLRYWNIHCDFCNVDGHNVNNCRNPELNQIESELHDEKDKMIMDPNVPTHNHIMNLCAKINSIFGENDKKLEAFAMIKCKYVRSRRQAGLYQYVANYIYENELPTNVVISQDYIPFDENDAVQYLIDIDMPIVTLTNETRRNNVKWVVVKETQCLTCNECPICYENFPSRKFAQMDCNHVFCVSCVKKIIKSNSNVVCALCRTPIQNIKTIE